MAKALGMKKVLVHKYGGILSAYGLSMADAVHEEQEPAAETYMGRLSVSGEERLQHLADRAVAALVQQGHEKEYVVVERYLNLRYQGTDNSIMIKEEPGKSFEQLFRAVYEREFGFVLEGRDILIDDYRVRSVVPGSTPSIPPPPPNKGAPPAIDTTRAFFENGWEDVPVYKSEDLEPGHTIQGPSIIVQPISTVVLEVACSAFVTGSGNLEIIIGSSEEKPVEEDEEIKEDPVQLSIFGHRYASDECTECKFPDETFLTSLFAIGS
jgi:5-oxoprolinase (ATP-hydrolysing)